MAQPDIQPFLAQELARNQAVIRRVGITVD
jgi:hypothetical protein